MEAIILQAMAGRFQGGAPALPGGVPSILAACAGTVRRLLVLAIGVAAIVSTPLAAHAQAEDQAVARALFNAGRELLKEQRYADACPKFEAARKLYESAGIVLNLGDCYEHLGRTASAWTEFGEALAIAQRTGRSTEAAEAAKRQAAIEPMLARLVVRVAHPTVGLQVSRDGAELPTAAWGAAIPVDPGAHDVRAAATGREPWSATVTVPPAGQVSIDVPELGLLPAGAPSRADTTESSAPEATPESTARSSTLDWVLIGGGAVVGLAGGALMIVESVRAADARDRDDPEAWDSTKAPWMIGLVGAAVGGISVGVGVALLSSSHEGAAPPTGMARKTPVLEFSGTW
jgi:hypothetical protein